MLPYDQNLRPRQHHYLLHWHDDDGNENAAVVAVVFAARPEWAFCASLGGVTGTDLAKIAREYVVYGFESLWTFRQQGSRVAQNATMVLPQVLLLLRLLLVLLDKAWDPWQPCRCALIHQPRRAEYGYYDCHHCRRH